MKCEKLILKILIQILNLLSSIACLEVYGGSDDIHELITESNYLLRTSEKYDSGDLSDAMALCSLSGVDISDCVKALHRFNGDKVKALKSLINQS